MGHIFLVCVCIVEKEMRYDPEHKKGAFEHLKLVYAGSCGKKKEPVILGRKS
jgi:hypothetical protein